MRHILALIPLFFVTTLFAQVRQTEHVELPIDTSHGTNYQLVKAGNEGVLCLLESQKVENNNKVRLQFTFFDTDLHTKWEQGYLVKNTAKLLGTSYDDGFIYILIQSKEHEYNIMKLNLSDGIISQIAFADFKDFIITHFDATKGTLLLGGNIKGKPAVILKRYDESNKPIVLPSINQLKAKLIDVVIDDKNQELVVLLDKRRPISDRALYVNRYALDGGIIKNTEITLSTEFNLITYRPHMADDGSLLLFGSYGMKTETLAQGIYSLTIKDGKLLENRFYDFGYLKNFFNYLPKNKRERYISKIRRKLKEGSRKRFGYRLFIHDLEVTDDRIILSGESYDPQTEYVRKYDMMAASNRAATYSYYPSARRYASLFYSGGYIPTAFAQDALRDREWMPSEYRYEHAFALGFSKSGALLWDNSYTFDDTKSNFPIEMTQASAINDTLAFLEYTEEKYHFKMSVKSDYVEENVSIKLPEIFEGDEQKTLDHGGLMRWYGRNFLMSGIKDFDNKLDKERKRHVFFISKFTFNPEWVDKPEEEEEAKNKEKEDRVE
ncbi:MAG: hypothetical protein ACPGJS_11155 [Flammeovirgaceae bacterium]